MDNIVIVSFYDDILKMIEMSKQTKHQIPFVQKEEPCIESNSVWKGRTVLFFDIYQMAALEIS